MADVITLGKLFQFVFLRERVHDWETTFCSVIELVLFDTTNELTPIAIKNRLEAAYGFKEAPLALIENGLSRLVRRGVVRESGGRYQLTPQRRKEIEVGTEQRERNERAIIQRLQKEFVQKGYHRLERKLRRALYVFLGLFLESRKVAALAQMQHSEYKPSPMMYADALLASSAVFNETEQQTLYISAMRKILKTPEFRDFFWDVLQAYLIFYLIRLHPTLPELRRAFFDHCVVYLDTNVVINILLESEKYHSICKSALETMTKLNMECKVSQYTVRELQFLLERADRLISQFLTDSSPNIKKSNNPFIRDYANEFARGSVLSWDDYYIKRQRWHEELAEAGVVIDTEEYEWVLQLPEYETVVEALQLVAENFKFPKSLRVAEHDAFHLLLVRELRQRTSRGKASAQFWFLTQDLTLYLGAQKFLNLRRGPPLCVMTDIWLQTLALFSAAEGVQPGFITQARDVIIEFLISPIAQALPRLPKERMIEVLRPQIGEASFEELYERCEAAVFRRWIEVPHELLVRQREIEFEENEREILRMKIKEYQEKLNQICQEVEDQRSELWKYKIITSILIMGMLGGGILYLVIVYNEIYAFLFTICLAVMRFIWRREYLTLKKAGYKLLERYRGGRS